MSNTPKTTHAIDHEAALAEAVRLKITVQIAQGIAGHPDINLNDARNRDAVADMSFRMAEALIARSRIVRDMIAMRHFLGL